MKVINEILYDKKQGIDCTEDESAYIKGWLRETIIKPGDGSQQVLEEIQLLFPIEYGEYLIEAATPSPLPETETGVSMRDKWVKKLETMKDSRAKEWDNLPDAEISLIDQMIQMCAEMIRDFSTPPPTPGNDNQESGGWFTPGQWLIEENTNHYPFVMGEDNNLIAMLIDGKDGSLFYGRSLEETKANSRLIASAPDMYRFLKEVLRLKFSNSYETTEYPAFFIKTLNEVEALINSITGGKETIN